MFVSNLLYGRSRLYAAALSVMMTGLSACTTTDTAAPQIPSKPTANSEPVFGPVVQQGTDQSTAHSSTDVTTPNGQVVIFPRQDTPSSIREPIISAPATPRSVSIGPSSIFFADYLPGWDQADPSPALTAFARNCPIWEKKDAAAALMTSRSEFGHYQDWQSVCASLPSAPYDANFARWTFETYFLPAGLLNDDSRDGLLTGYYEPEIEVRLQPDAIFSEPILAKPDNDALQNKSRSAVIANQAQYSAHAYGRPIDVFFMQVQGSGRMRFEDGSIKRAAYGGHNSHKYKSIGGVLISRGEMTREQASKQSIEAWMNNAGPAQARALMNENPRYIYFALETIDPTEGPKGSMRVPLTAMGSMAIDPKSRPYGVPVWLETTLPQFSGDYKGAPQSLLVIAQDSGSAIKGEGRGDLFFGSGDLAGELAGVMKHDVTMRHLLPRDLVLRQLNGGDLNSLNVSP